MHSQGKTCPLSKIRNEGIFQGLKIGTLISAASLQARDKFVELLNNLGSQGLMKPKAHSEVSRFDLLEGSQPASTPSLKLL